MRIINKNLEILIIFILLLIIAISYFNYIFFGGFGTGDDLTNVLRVTDQNYNLLESIKNNLLGNQASRPISLILKEIVHFFFRENVRIYIIFNILTWFLSVIFISFVLSNFVNKNINYTFILLSSFPFFSSAIFAGPYLFTSYIFCIFLWSLSIFFVIIHAKNNKKIYYFLSLFLIILSLLTLEYIFPLFILSALLPICYKLKEIGKVKRKFLIKLFIIYVLPLIIILIIFLLFKIYFVKFYANINNIYGLTNINIKSFLQSFYFIIVILVEVPILLIESLKYLSKIKLVILAPILLTFFYLIIKSRKKDNYKPIFINNVDLNKILIIIFLISLLSSSLIFFISFYPSTTFGHYNKMMLPSFISLSLLISILINNYINKKFFILPFIFTFLWISSMNIQLDNFVKSWEIRNLIAKDISSNIDKAKIKDNFIIVANVPYFLIDNYNNELVTFTIWNFEAHINLLNNSSYRVYPISDRIINDKNFYPNHNILNKLNEILISEDIYYYQIQENLKKGKLKYLGNKNDLINKIKEIKSKKINSHPIILRENLRLRMINLAEYLIK